MTEHRALCGWLMKQDAQSLWRGWKRRWFQQLHDFQLYYFVSCTTDISLSKGFIDIKSVINVQADTAGKDKHVFHIITAERTYVLQAASDDEVNYWITGLNAIIANLSQPLTTLIDRAEIFDKQHQQLQKDRQRASMKISASPKMEIDDRKSRHASMRFQPLDPAATDKSQPLPRSNSAQNITYIDYANTPPPETAQAQWSAEAASKSMNYINLPKSTQWNADSASKSTNRITPPAHAYASSTPSTPTLAPVSAPTSAPSTPTLVSLSGPAHSQTLQEQEKEQMENKKRASMRDLQALIVREKDAEIARLTMEVVRLSEIQEQAIRSTREVREQYQQQIDQMKIDEHLRYTELERRMTDQLDEANFTLRNRSEECARAVDENETLRVELAQVRQDTEQKVNILESEIKLKENIVAQLNSTITSLNGELSAKDTLLDNSMRNIKYKSASDDVLLVAQLEKERETKHALQEQCAFLGQEVFKLETELKHQKILVEEQKNKILERNNTTSTSPGKRAPEFASSYSASNFKYSSANNSSNNNSSTNNINNGNGSTSGNFSSVAEDNMKLLAIENKDLREKYFMSVGRSLKLQTTMNGGYSNVSVVDLYDRATRANIKIEDWPNWISNHLANTLQSPTQPTYSPS